MRSHSIAPRRTAIRPTYRFSHTQSPRQSNSTLWAASAFIGFLAGGFAACGSDSADPDVPNNAYCDPVANWDPVWAEKELAVLSSVNANRSTTIDCGAKGQFQPAAALEMNDALRCAARVHTMDMVARGFFDHINPDGETPWDRMGQAGYTFSTAGENIACGTDSSAAVMQLWMGSDGHCANIMSQNFQHLGIGYYSNGTMHCWTQTFGSP